MPDPGRGSELRQSTRGRRLGIGDLLVLVGAVAVSLAYARLCLANFTRLEVIFNPSSGWLSWVHEVAFTINTFVACCLIVFSPVQLLMRMVGPRPRWCRLFREPGTVACLAATCLLLFSLSPIYSSGIRPAKFLILDTLQAWLKGIPSRAPDRCGAAVIGAWLTLASGRSGRRGDAVDLLGRFIGVGWCCSCLVNTTLTYSLHFD